MSAPITGQTGALSGTAQRLDSNNTAAGCVAFTIKAPATNANTAFIGGSGVTTSSGHALDPGDVYVYERKLQNGQPQYVLRPTDIYVVGTSPDVVTWFASPGIS